MPSPPDDETTTADPPIDTEDEGKTVKDRPRSDSLDGSRAMPSSRYRATTELGRGGMGEVVGARDTVLGREIAIKRIHPKSRLPLSILHRRFFREARIQAALDHPAIPPVHDLGTDAKGQPYFVMKKLVGITLLQILQSMNDQGPAAGKKFSRERMLRAFAEVCLAVELAHTRGVVHRDLKPSNIMLGDFGEVYVLDWGVAKLVGKLEEELAEFRDADGGEATRAGAIVGTRAYMAPEQARGEDVDARADVFALGNVLRDILAVTGESPPELDLLRDHAIAPDREERIATARELGERVLSYLDGDRDHALRSRLAEEHLTRARATTDARAAMQEVTRALALDPRLPGASELLVHLVASPPPDESAPEVELAIAQSSAELTRHHARLSLRPYLGYLAMVPGALLLGVHAVVPLVTVAAIVVVLLWCAWRMMQRTPVPPLVVWIPIVGNAVLLAATGLLFSPITIVPGMAAVTTMIFLASPIFRTRRRMISVLLLVTAGALLPWALEMLELIDPSVTFAEGFLRIRPTVAHVMVEAPLRIGLILIVPILVMIMVTTALPLARSEEAARRKLHAQSWWLSQLIAPRGMTATIAAVAPRSHP